MGAMRRLNRCSVVCTALAALFFSSAARAQQITISDIRQAIAEKGAAWKADENWVTRLDPAERDQLFGAEQPEHMLLKNITVLDIPAPAMLPRTLDWRDNNGNWVTAVRNQGGCGSCWAFSAVGQVESWWKIYNTMPDSAIDLSEQFLLSSGEAGSCGGGQVTAALDYIQQTGLPPEWCMTYQATDTIPQDEVYPGWEQYKVTIPAWGYITGFDASVENIKNALQYHPVSASFTVYEDFNYYSGGVYEHVAGEEKGGHAIVIVGYSDSDSAWVCKNSWGPYWGENGYFRIKWGQCGIGQYLPFIWDGTSAPGSFYAQSDTVSFELKQGESQTVTLSLVNSGQSPVEFAALKESVPIVFHPNTFNAYQDTSWWCGDPGLGGYANHWLQYLDTPVLDLNGTAAPQLSFQAYWSIEDPAGTDPPWDGWDGCNVWISTDRGETFSVIDPVNPFYTCRHLWSFGHPDQGWNMGENIPGWAGQSGGWVDVRFDLSPWNNSSDVVIRWAFASDKGFCTADADTITGFFLDNLCVADGIDVLFFNNGSTQESMETRGFGEAEAAWITVENGVGTIGAGQMYDMDITVSAKGLRTGNYRGYISFSTNSSVPHGQRIPVLLNVLPAGDTGVETEGGPVPDSPLLKQNFPNPFNGATVLEYTVKKAGDCTLSIYDVRGREITRLVNGYKPPGVYRAQWHGMDSMHRPVSTGVYIGLFAMHGTVSSVKMVYVK